jgi:predicted DNA binding CopG/RHH family protein
MTKKRSASSAPARRHGKSVRHISDSKIDFSDIPELTDAELAGARRVGRPRTGNAKQLIAIRIAPALLEKIVKLAAEKKRPYQTLMHEMLEAAVKRAA